MEKISSYSLDDNFQEKLFQARKKSKPSKLTSKLLLYGRDLVFITSPSKLSKSN